MHRIQKENSNILAVCEVILNECFTIRGIQVMNSSKGKFVKMPAVKGSDNQYRDIAFPITKQARESITNRVLKTYERLCQMEQGFQLEDLKVRTYPTEGKENFKGYASINIQDVFAINGIKILHGKKGLFVSMPAWLKNDGTYGDFCTPLTKDAAQIIQEAVVMQYQIDLERDREVSEKNKEQEKNQEESEEVEKPKKKKQERSR